MRLKLLYRNRPYRVLAAASGARGLSKVASELPDLVVLDLTMPGMSGQEVCRRIRKLEDSFPLPIPVLILTGDERIRQEAHCLDLGADDYLVKRTPAVRLMARIRSLIRRRRFHGSPKGGIEIGGVALNTATRKLAIPSRRSLSLTRTESALCALLMATLGNPIDRKILHKKIYNAWPPHGSKSIEMHVNRIRKKLGRFAGLIAFIADAGYRFDVEYAREHSGTRERRALKTS